MAPTTTCHLHAYPYPSRSQPYSPYFSYSSLLRSIFPTPATMTFIQDLLKPGGGVALIPFIRGTIATLLVLVM
eukprot:scaffold2349_cov140-Skeletonema_menzelii.AAC.3